MRILFIHNNYAENNSGEEHAANGLASLLERHGHDVEWYRRSSDEIAASSLGQIKAFFTGLYNPVAVSEVKKLLATFKPQVVQVQNLYPLISPAVLKIIKKAGIPIIMRCPNYRLFCPNGLHLDPKGNICEKCLTSGREIHCVLKNCEHNRSKSIGYALRNYTARRVWGILKYVDIYIVQTEFQRQKFIQNGIPAKKLVVLPGLTSQIEEGKFHLGDFVTFVGRVSAEKGIVEFIEAARLLPDIPFIVAGNVGKQWSYLQKKSPSNVQWAGFVEGKALDDLYHNSRIIVVPGKWYEGFPNVITRAMQNAKPVITSNLGAMASIIDHGENGFLVEPGNAEKLAQSIDSLYKNSKLCKKFGLAGHIKAQKKYSSDRIYQILIGVYQSLTDVSQLKKELIIKK